MNGWIKLHRCIADNWVWQDKPFSKGQAWIDILMMANHEPAHIKTRTDFVDIERGSFHTEVRSLMARWGWGNTKVNNFLSSLEREKMIEKTVKKSVSGQTTEGTTIKVLNYCIYQDNQITEQITEQINGKSTANQRQINGKPKQEPKKVEKGKNVKNVYGSEKNVFLSDLEYERLKKEFPCADEAIEYLSGYIVEKAYVTKDHNKTIRRWVIDAVMKKQPKQQSIKDFI